jgi:hypothetical protein
MFKKILIALLVIISLLVLLPQRLIAEDQVIVASVVETEVKAPLTFEQHIEHIFGENAKIATAVLTHESSLNLKAKHYNCRYVSAKTGKLYSTTCKKGDSGKAWSVDCGIAQVNVKGQICPSNLMTLEGNMVAVERIYNEQGLKAWVSYKSGAYLKFLKDS